MTTMDPDDERPLTWADAFARAVTAADAARAALTRLARHPDGDDETGRKLDAAAGAIEGALALLREVLPPEEGGVGALAIDFKVANLLRGRKRRQGWDLGHDLYKAVVKMAEKSPENARKLVDAYEAALTKCTLAGYR